jgi:hypothetical protein
LSAALFELVLAGEAADATEMSAAHNRAVEIYSSLRDDVIPPLGNLAALLNIHDGRQFFTSSTKDLSRLICP